MTLFTLAFGGSAAAATVYDEALSGDRSSPTVIGVATGNNAIFGATGRATSSIDRDYFSIALNSNQRLTAILVLSGTVAGGNVSFIGVEAGNQTTLPTTAATAAGLLGWWHYGAADVGFDILRKMSIAAEGSSGFTPPLGAGVYSFWIQDFNRGRFNYGFDLVITAVPLPPGFGLLGLGLAAALARGDGRPDPDARDGGRGGVPAATGDSYAASRSVMQDLTSPARRGNYGGW